MSYTKRNIKYIYEYNRKTYKAYSLRINKNKDADIIEFLKHKESVNNYLIELIRRDMEVNKVK